MEAKQCSDGSYVGRTGLRCEFAQCPVSDLSAKETGEVAIVRGRVILSPVCPVEKMPPDPACAPRPYQTTVEAFLIDGTERIETVQSLSDGSFIFKLPYGDYYLETVGGEVFPRCETVNLKLNVPILNSVSIFCDTGIR